MKDVFHYFTHKSLLLPLKYPPCTAGHFIGVPTRKCGWNPSVCSSCRKVCGSWKCSAFLGITIHHTRPNSVNVMEGPVLFLMFWPESCTASVSWDGIILLKILAKSRVTGCWRSPELWPDAWLLHYEQWHSQCAWCPGVFDHKIGNERGPSITFARFGPVWILGIPRTADSVEGISFSTSLTSRATRWPSWRALQ